MKFPMIISTLKHPGHKGPQLLLAIHLPEVMWRRLVVALLGQMANGHRHLGQPSPRSLNQPEDCVDKFGYEHWHTIVHCSVPVTIGCCAAQCSEHKDCNVWTHSNEGHWTNNNEENGTCYLQSSTTQRKNGLKLMSGAKSCLPPVSGACSSYTSYPVNKGTSPPLGYGPGQLPYLTLTETNSIRVNSILYQVHITQFKLSLLFMKLCTT